MLRDELKPRLGGLAAQGVYLGTSSWKYPGWCGSIYDEARYAYRNRFAKTRFEANCLAEYAQTFSTVCVDAAYYQFPSPKYLEGLVAQVPPDFRFGLKVTDLVTIKKFPNLPRFGQHAGRPNENFLNADLFTSAFIKPCEPFRPFIGTLIFEFSRFYSADYAHGQNFVADLDRFLGALPGGWPYAVDLRNRHWLQPDYFAMLARHNEAHAWNSWSAMPAVSDQLALAGSLLLGDLHSLQRISVRTEHKQLDDPGVVDDPDEAFGHGVHGQHGVRGPERQPSPDLGRRVTPKKGWRLAKDGLPLAVNGGA